VFGKKKDKKKDDWKPRKPLGEKDPETANSTERKIVFEQCPTCRTYHPLGHPHIQGK